MMTWQEYQEAVAVLYEQADGFGNVIRNVMVPDKITGQPRQIDGGRLRDAKGRIHVVDEAAEAAAAEPSR